MNRTRTTTAIIALLTLLALATGVAILIGSVRADAAPQRDTPNCADHGEVTYQKDNLPALWGDVRQRLDPDALVIKHYRNGDIIRGYFRPCWTNSKLVLTNIDNVGIGGDMFMVYGSPAPRDNLCVVDDATVHAC